MKHEHQINQLTNCHSYVIGHMTIKFPIHLFIFVPHCDQAPISSAFRDIGSKTLLSHDLDFSGSRDVIGHMTIVFPIPLFLFVPHCDQAPISSPFRDIEP